MRMKVFLLLGLFLPFCFGCCARVREYKVQVVHEYPHDRGAYTQGLFFNDGILCESTGQYGESTYREVDLTTGNVRRKVSFARKYFGEGSCVLDGKLYILTWTNNVAFTYDPKTLEYIQGYSYPREGWGLTTDGRQLIASDGSNRLFFLDKDLRLQKTVNVTMDGRPVRYLNELEWIDGKVWANVYTTDMIVIINPSTGVVEGKIDCTGLLPKSLKKPDTDVLNGIAVCPSDGRIYLTGKNWPRLYEVKLLEKR